MDDSESSEDYWSGEESDDHSSEDDGVYFSDEEGSSISGDEDSKEGLEQEADQLENTTWVENKLCKRTSWRHADAEGRIVCCLCRRRFHSEEQIRRHERMSESHYLSFVERHATTQGEIETLREQRLDDIELMQTLHDEWRQRKQRKQRRSQHPLKKK